MLGKVWLLYRPEPFHPDSDDNQAIHLWIRRCEVFSERENIDKYLKLLLGFEVTFRKHELFPELEIGFDERGFRWFVCPADTDPLV